MTSTKAAACAFFFLFGVLASATAAAGNVRFGFHFGFPVFPPYWYYAPPPVYYYPQPIVTAPPAPAVYVERSPAAAAPPAEHYWYYCADTQAYYPYVKECGSEWQRVSPRPPGM
jgi:hypothetical protein